jgi:hypothetical protein
MAALEAGDKENLPGSGRLRRRMDPGIDFASGEEETQPLRGGGVKCRADGIGRWFTPAACSGGARGRSGRPLPYARLAS